MKDRVLRRHIHGIGAPLHLQLHCVIEHQQPIVRVVIRAHCAAAAFGQRELHSLRGRSLPAIAVEDQSAGLHLNLAARGGVRRRGQRGVLLFWDQHPGLPWLWGRSPEPLSASSA